MTILVTGGAGFIGSNFAHHWLDHFNEKIVNLDKLTYAGNLNNFNHIRRNNNYVFVRGDISDTDLVTRVFREHQPRAVVNFAAETHVDRSIKEPKIFLQTNVMGTFHLLECAKIYWSSLSTSDQKAFRFLQVSTDEVYGSLSEGSAPFSENSRYGPNSPYSATKASSDHLIRAYHQTYGFPVLTTHCTNNYGPYQFPEKLIPLIICNAITHKPLPIYGDGLQIRDWLYVSDHCSAICLILENGKIGETYNIGGLNQLTNTDVVLKLCDILDGLKPSQNRNISSYRELIQFVEDRPGHDRRYGINPKKIEEELGWRPTETFDTGILKTVKWYLEHKEWVEQVKSGEYRRKPEELIK